MSVIVIEDHPRMRQLISRSVGANEGLELLAAVGTAEEALELIRDATPDLFIIDISLPGMNGLELVKHLSRQGGCRCLMLSGHIESDYVRAAKRAGARGFVSKGEPDRLSDAIRAVLADGQYWPADLEPGPGSAAP